MVPIAPELAKELFAYRDRSYPMKEGWLFASPATEKPYHLEESSEEALSDGREGGGRQVQSRVENVQAQLSFVA